MKIAIVSVTTCVMLVENIDDLLPLQLSVVELRNQTNVFNSYIDPTNNVSYKKLPGMFIEPTQAVMKKIRWEATNEYPSTKACLSKLKTFLSENHITHLFAHRCTSFDEKVLRACYKKTNMEMPDVLFMDTLPMLRHETNRGKRSLRELCHLHLSEDKYSMNTSLDMCYALIALLKEFEYQGLIRLPDTSKDNSFTGIGTKGTKMDNKWINEFIAADDDKNGFIDLEEFKAWHSSKYESLFQLTDLNGDGLVSQSEFKASDGLLGKWMKEFIKADTDNNGFIDLKEFEKWHCTKTASIFDAADVNGDGVLSKTEFKAMLSKLEC